MRNKSLLELIFAVNARPVFLSTTKMCRQPIDFYMVCAPALTMYIHLNAYPCSEDIVISLEELTIHQRNATQPQLDFNRTVNCYHALMLRQNGEDVRSRVGDR